MTIVSESLIHEWADKRGLLGEDMSPVAQAAKMMEEATETLKAVVACEAEGDRCRPVAVLDGIGDVWVTLVILASQYQSSLDACAWQAWQEIKDRKGVTSGGMFIKETDQ
ncbi:MAG: hypothetical protein H7842_02450 [Gammaproteobacteria bacterium SHHR-1]